MSNDRDMVAALEAAELKLKEARRAVDDGQQRGISANELATLTDAKNRAWRHLEALREKFRRR